MLYATGHESNDWCLFKRETGYRYTHGGSRPHTTSDWGEAAADQGTPEVAGRQELGRGDGGLAPAVWRKSMAC